MGGVFGSGNLKEIGSVVRQGLFFALFLSIPCIIFMRCVYPILIFFHQPTASSLLVAQYFNGMSYSVIPFLLLLVLTQFIIGIGKPLLSMVVVALGLPVGLVLSYGLLFGKLGMPNLGIVGAADASVVTAWLSLIGLFLYLFLNRQFRLYDFSIFKKITDFVWMRQFCTIGWPIAVQRGAEMLAFSVLTLMMGLVGDFALAAQQIVLQFVMLAMMIPFSFSQAGGVLVGYAVGQNDYAKARAESYSCVFLGVFFAILIGICFVVLPKHLIHFYSHQSANISVENLSVVLFQISAVTLLFDTIRNIAIGVLRGFYDTVYPMIVGVCACWVVGIPMAYWFGFMMHWGAPGISLGFMMSIIVSALLVMHRLHKQSASSAPVVLNDEAEGVNV